MITPSIKTNLILKEMGITRYELRSHQEKFHPKKIYSYQKGNILTLLKQSYDDLSKDEAKLLEAIIDAVNSANNQTSHNNSNLDDINDFISSCIDIKGIISFSSDVDYITSSTSFVQSSPLESLISDKESKKILWKKLQKTIL
ncbi:DNA polymerase III subunit psi [Gammaproteobacteria bacterium]|jgi:DNA polymerase III psi subunit|nr:DNA polymerase III subunit psi [Gammaproteobacteria bacterium]